MSRWTAAVLLLALLSTAHAQDAGTLASQAEAAYEAKDYAASAALYDQAAESGEHAKGFYYNAACANALAGRKDRAFSLLELAIAKGYSNLMSLGGDPDLASLRAEPRWQALLGEVAKRHPDAPYYHLMMDQSKSVFARYFPTRVALDGGLVAPPRDKSSFMDFYATMATFVGEYDEAHARYSKPSEADPVPSGHLRAVPANALVLARAKDRDYVLLNESHAQVQTRAALYTLLAPLREAGFTHLALEALSSPHPEPAGDTACAAPLLFDDELPQRGFPVKQTGYYTSEPVYGELLREALRLGFILVSYDGGDNGGPREQHQARMIACIRERNPGARVVVIGGFGHIAKDPDRRYPGGMMGHRLGELTQSDPLSVDMTELLTIDASALQFPATDAGRGAQAYALLDAQGQPFARKGYDLSLYVRAPAHRGEPGGSWLELGGARRATPIDPALCRGQRPCVLQARGEGEDGVAISEDSCVLQAGTTAACTLYLRPGVHTVSARDREGALIGEQVVSVAARPAREPR
jgi:tetratricopeptide (TPR) repeat protein